jgi:GDP-mannose 4,6-dehydratase
MTQHLSDLCRHVCELVVLGEGDVVVDIGSNDGTLLKSYSAHTDVSLVRVGIDPSAPQFSEFYPSDVIIVPSFFDTSAYRSLSLTTGARVVTSVSMFYDLPDPVGFARDVKSILAPDGVWVMEQSYLPTMLSQNSFDTICHEHLEYYCLSQIEWICRASGLRVLDVSLNMCNGGSFRVSIVHEEDRRGRSRAVGEMVRAELEARLDTGAPYAAFRERCELQRTLLLDFLHQQRRDGKSVHLYGASTKGNTLLQYYGIDGSLVRSAAERNPRKFGCRTPATSIPIQSEAEVRAQSPDFFLVLPWHFRDEFVERERDFLDRGGKLVFPLPHVEAVCSASLPTALVLGAGGQLGAHLVRSLVRRGYSVFGSTHGRTSMFSKQPLLVQKDQCRSAVGLEVDITSSESLASALRMIRPLEVYNLAAMTDSEASLEHPCDTLTVNGNAVFALLRAVRCHAPNARVFQAGSTELYKGCLGVDRLDETFTDFHPRTPYGIGKLVAYWAVRNARELEGLFCCTGILTNCESPFRRSSCVTKKLADHARHVASARASGDPPLAIPPLVIGDCSIRRDWLDAEDATDAMWHMLQQDIPKDCLVASGQVHTIEEFALGVLRAVGITAEWQGSSCVERESGTVLIVSDPSRFSRPYEKGNGGGTKLCIDAILSTGWCPSRSTLPHLCSSMVRF